MPKGGNQTLQLQQVFIGLSELRPQLGRDWRQYPRILPRVDRKAMLKIKDAEFTFLRVKAQLQLTAMKHDSVLVCHYQHKHLALQFILQWLPIDIEKICIGGGLAIFQNHEPPSIVGAHHSHMVVHDVEDLSHRMFMQGRDKLLVFFWRSNLRIQVMMIDDVVAVHTPWSSAQIRRRITMRNTQRSKVRNSFGGVGKSEMLIELQAISRERNSNHSCSNQTAENAGSLLSFNSLQRNWYKRRPFRPAVMLIS